jgi:hypothetical protein
LSGTPPDLVYSAFTNFHGMDSFDYAVTDGASTSKVATVSISVVSSDDPPVIGALLDVSLRKNAFAGPLLLELWDVDTPSNELQLWAETTNEELIPTNRITFTEGDTNRQVMIWPNNGATGAAEITVRVSDGLASAFSRFVLTVTNTPPTARDDQFVEPAEMLVIPASRLLANDFDLDQEQLRLVEVRPSAMGKSVVLTNESVIYFGGTTAIQDSFRYEVEDGSGGRASATVWLTLTEGARITSLDVIDGNVRLEVIGKPNADFEVLSTADGVSWEIRGTGHSDEIGKGEFIDSGGASKHHRFYRAQWR